MKRPAFRHAGNALGGLALALVLAGCSGGASDAELTSAAKALLDKKDTKGAVIQLKNALQKNPKSGEARLLLGKTLLESGDPVAALVELRKAQELEVPDDKVVPDIARAMLLVGEEAKIVSQYRDLALREAVPAADLKSTLAAAYGVQNDMENARKSLAEALRLQPGYPPALIVQARIAAAGGDLDGALAVLDQALAADPGNERAGTLKGDLLLAGKKQPDAALAAFRKVVDVHPTSVAARASVVNILLGQKKVAEAKTEFAELQKVAPNHPETLYYDAQLAFEAADYKRCREITDRILKAMPDNPRVLELAGAAEFRMKNYLQAEAMLTHALKVMPKMRLSRLLLVQTYLRSGQPDKAVELLRPAVESSQADATVLALAGEAYLAAGDTRRSQEAFARALKAAPEDNRVRTAAAMAQAMQGNTGAAATELEAVASGDTGTRADLALISARLRNNDLPGALKAIDALEKKVPEQPLPYQLRGRVLMLKNDLAGATKNFNTALTKDPAYFAAVASLAAIDLAGGKPELARKRFDEYLKANPKSSPAKLALAELEARTGAPTATVTATLREAAKLNPNEPMPHLVLINRLIATGEGAEALHAAQDAVAALPNNLQIMDALGRAELAAGDAQRSITTFKKLAALQPKNPDHELRLADAYLAAKDNEAASRSLRRALELKPGLVPAQRGLAVMALRNDKPQEALKIARDLQQAQPKDAAGWLLEGEIEGSRKNWDAATSAYRTALQRTRNTETAIKLHMALVNAGKGPDADRLAAEWNKEQPRDAGFRYYLGDAALSRNDFARAEVLYRAVLEVQPENALALNNVAWLMVKQGKPGAVALAEKANTLLPERAPLLDTLAVALEADNQLPKAVEVQKKAIALAPNDANMSLRLAKLYLKQGDKPRARAELEALAKLGDKFGGQAEVSALLKTL